MALVYLAVAWGVGIWLARWVGSLAALGCGSPTWPAWTALLAALGVGLFLGWKRPRCRRGAALLLFLVLGALRYQQAPFDPCFGADDLAYYRGALERPAWATVTGVVQRPPEEIDSRQRIRLRAESLTLDRGQPSLPVGGSAMFALDRYPGLRYGDRIAVRGRLEAPPVFAGFDYREYLARHGVHTVIQQPEVTLLGRDAGSGFWQGLYLLRLQAQQVIARLLPEPEAGLLTGILLGVESGIDRDLYDEFNRTGVSHIIVISGFNITIISGLMTALFARLFGPRRAVLPVMLSILLYVLLVGADAAVVRAGIMGILVVWATALQRQSTAMVSLFAAGFVMTLLNPLTLWDVGFQLSFVATLSLILFATPMTRWFESAVRRRVPAAIAHPLIGFLDDALIVTLAATALTLPLIAYYFGRVSVVAPLTNLLVLPVQPPVMVWGGLAVLVGLPATLHPALEAVLWPVARALAAIPWLALHWTVLVVRALASCPFASAQVHLGVAGLWGYFGLVGLLLLARHPSFPLLAAVVRRIKRTVASSRMTTIVATLLLVAAVLLLAALRSQPDGRLHVHVLALEQGEAVLIVTPDGQQALIDGGASATALLAELGRLMPFYDRTLELVVLTHAGDQRVAGLAGLPERFTIRQALQAPFPYPSAAYTSWLAGLRDQGTTVVPAQAGARLLLGHSVSLDVLHPGPEPALDRQGAPDPDANALVLRLSYGDTSLLLLGDAPRTVQDELAAAGLVQPATAVVLAQGGGLAGFSQALLNAAQPRLGVVVTPRDDRWRRLAPAVEAAWKAQVGEAGWRRTDLAGPVNLASDGRQVTVEP